MSESDLSQDRELLTLPRDAEGRPVVGRLPLERRIGRGGMGAVYYALHPRLHVPVAVKILPHHLLEEDPSLADRFLSEARLAASLENENIVRVYDVDRDGPTFFLVMAFVDGESGGALLRRRGALPESDALTLVTAATRGLAAAHARGIVHRDIKPDNILVPREGGLARAKLADLGLAKPFGSAKSIGTSANVAMGTPGYMPPEQIDDARSVGPAADVFAMGATLYALLAGTPPFTGSSIAAILRDTGTVEPPPLPAGVTPALNEIVARCLHKNPSRRYANGTELLTALVGIAQATPGTLTVGPGELPRRRSVAWVFLLVLAAAIAAIVAYKFPSVPPHGLVARWKVPGGEATARKAGDYIVRRLQERGFPHARVEKAADLSLELKVPGARPDDEAILRAIGESGLFEFREVGNQLEHLKIGPSEEFELIDPPVLGSEYAFIAPKMRVRRLPVVTGADVVSAAVADANGRATVSVELTPEAAVRFDALALKLFNQKPHGIIAILVNGQLKSAPQVKAESFQGHAEITGLSKPEAEELARALRGGGLPCPLDWVDATPYGQ